MPQPGTKVRNTGVDRYGLVLAGKAERLSERRKDRLSPSPAPAWPRIAVSIPGHCYNLVRVHRILRVTPAVAAGIKESHMPLDSETRRRIEILRLLRDCGGMCTEQQWKEFLLSLVHLDPYLLGLIASGYVRHDQVNTQYILTDNGKAELTRLEGLSQG